MNTKALRQKILDLAIHGKLVPQDPNDEPASVLLERIRAEKERLIKEGKIKKPKKAKATCDKPRYEYKEPFEIPSSWEWCKLGNVNEIARGGSPRPIKDYLTNDANGINWIKIGDTTKDGKYIDSVKEKIRPEGVKKSRLVHKGDFLLTNSMSFGRPYILNVDGCIHDGWLVISPIGKAYTSDFLYYLLSSSFAFEQFTNVASGGVVTNLNSDKVADTIFPLPPYDEQKRIVSEIERCFALIDVIEYKKRDLRVIIKQAKSKILDLAIHGKLIPQEPNDEPASELLKRINPKAEITCDNPRYGKLPDTWVWTTLGEISNYGDNKSVAVENIDDDAWILELEDLEKDTANIIQKIKKKERIIKGVRHSFSKGNILYSKLRTYLNKVLIAPDDGYCTTEMIAFDANDQILNDYICYVLRSKFFVGYTKQCGYGVKMPRLSTTDARKGLIPLPPINEQHRIVAKIEELFAQLDKIESSL